MARAGLLVIALSFLVPPGAAEAAARSYPNLFGTKETHSSNLVLFKKWRDSVQRYVGEQKACPPGLCDAKRWRDIIAGLRTQGRMQQLDSINTAMNKFPYILDEVNWGAPDYWETPFEFLRRSGDCEDYAISKFMALRAAGLADEDMRVVVLRDLNLKLGHAVLVVYVDDKAYILDNQIKKIVPADSIRHYQPIYSINEEGWWLHKP
jgi:predicted transglutaminase-like cysteine proteinase